MVSFRKRGSFIKTKLYKLKVKIISERVKGEITNLHVWHWRTTKVVVKVVSCTRTCLLLSLECYQNQMLRCYSTYQYDSEPYEEEEYYPLEDKLFDDDEDDELNENRQSCSCNDDFCLSRVTSPGRNPGQDEDNESDDDNHNHVCLCDPTDFNAGACCCNYLGLSCNGKCRPDGYDRWLISREPINRQTFGYQVKVLSTI